MGFSVTAANVIFGIALLGAFSVASNAYWKNASTIEAAQRTMNERAVKEVHANLTLSSPSWDDAQKTESFTLKNSGTVGFDLTHFEYMFDGNITYQTQNTDYPKLDGANPPTSRLLLPGDALDCQFVLATQPSKIMVVTEFGDVFAHDP